MSIHTHSDRSGYTSGMSFRRNQINQADQARATPSWRWLAVLLVSILLHWFALEWANGVIVVPHWHDEPAEQMAIVQLQAPVLPASTPTKPKPVPKPHPHKAVNTVTNKVANEAAKAPPPPPAPIPPLEPTPSTALTQDAPAKTANTDVDASAPSEAASGSKPAPAVAVDQPKTDAPPEVAGPPHYKTELPPSVELKYDVSKVVNQGSPYYGSGTISWQNNGSTYQVTGEAHLLFFSLINFKSEGSFDDFGVAPVLYSEKKINRSQTNTHFNRDERNSISFSSSKLNLIRKGGEQDRASVLWELAGIARGDREKFIQGAQLELLVEGDRDGDNWSILVVGQEEIETGAGKTLAWHVRRIPRAGTYEHQFDIWLAPQFQWSPVRIRDTEKNGDYTEMSMSSFHPLQVAGTPPDPAH
ncbi:MAG TPA: DUF3108 domain-containing protein [Burkholderiaceae bacterium]|nr:DUF3108 domain-containing protein [Burkholderiaceae bacterium]